MPDLPPEIDVTDRGDDDITFRFPLRPIGPLRHLGWPLLAAGGLFLYWVVWMGVTNLKGHPPQGVEDYIMLGLGAALGLGAYFPLWLGLAILAGRREVTLRHEYLYTGERVGPLRRFKRWPVAKLSRVEIIPITPTAGKAEPGSLLSRLDALAGALDDGTRFMIAPAYPRRLLGPVAAELARRCNAKYDPDRPAVVVTTVDAVDPLADWNDGAMKQPADSRAVLDEYPEGMTITLPPAGFRGGGGTMLAVGLLMAGVMVGLFSLTRDLPIVFRGLFAGLGLIGSLVAIHGVRVARRRAVIAIVGHQLLVLQTGLVRSKERRWPADELAAVRVGPSGMKINDVDVLELQIMPRAGDKYGLLGGRDVAEIGWVAAVVRRRLGVPAAK
jgi:hypothetical protein